MKWWFASFGLNFGCAGGIVLGLLTLAAPVHAGGKGANPKAVKAIVDKAVNFLKVQQTPEGAFSPRFAGTGISALAASGMIRNGISPKEPVVAKTLDYLGKQVQPDGGIYNKFLANYTTSVALMTFKEANTNGQYDTIIKNGASFLKSIQNDAALDSPSHGGFGYDKKSRPDMSNTAFTIDALLAAGVPKDDPAIKKALAFVSRCQNLESESYNDLPFAKKASKDDKGGFTYTPVDAEKGSYKTPAGGLRSLGAMSYNGLKSFLYAGVDRDDERVKAAVNWIRHHYTLKENPGMGQAGVYYYYHTFAKAMDAWGEDEFVDAQGKKHNWRKELATVLKARQLPNGSWINKGDRTFGESNPELATAFAILAISYTVDDKK